MSRDMVFVVFFVQAHCFLMLGFSFLYVGSFVSIRVFVFCLHVVIPALFAVVVVVVAIFFAGHQHTSSPTKIFRPFSRK